MNTHHPAADVLLVDDNVDICTALARMMKINGLKGECVHTGREALAYVRQHRPALVILDVSMPDISGADVLREIRADAALHDLPVVLHSALDEQQVLAIAASLQANGVLLKGRSSLTDVLSLVDQLRVRPAAR